jgi:hypothetical protein
MYHDYYAERMMAHRTHEMAEIQINAQRVREATITHEAPRFYASTLPTHGEARLYRPATGSDPRRTVRVGRVMISW